MSNDEWYYKQEGNENGPYSETHLRHQLINRFIPVDTLIRGPGVTTWTPANQVFPDICSPPKKPITKPLEEKEEHTTPPADGTIWWYYYSNGQKKGPVSREELQALFKTRTLSFSTLLKREDMAGWIRADAVFSHLRPENVPPPCWANPDSPESELHSIPEFILDEIIGLLFEAVLVTVLDIFSPSS